MSTKRNVTLYASNVDYLQDELEWVRTRCRRLAYKLKLEKLEGMDEDEFNALPAWRRKETPAPSVMDARTKRLQRKERALRKRIDARLAHHEALGKATRLQELCTMHGLDDFERHVVLLAVAPCFSREFEELYTQLDPQDLSHGLTVEVVFAFRETPFAERIDRRTCFSLHGGLIKNDVLVVEMGNRFCGPKDLLTADIEVTSRTFAYLVGNERLRDEFMEFSSVEEPMATFEQVVLPQEDRDRILAVVDNHDRYLMLRSEWGFDERIRYGRGAFMLFHGQPGTGKTMTAHAIAERAGKRILNVDIPAFLQHADAQRFLPGLFREARLQNALLFFDECEALFASRAQGNVLMTILLTELERFDGLAILATNLPELLDEALDRRLLLKVRFGLPDRQARRRIWERHLPPAAPLDNDVDLEVLADRYELSGGLIKNAVLLSLGECIYAAGENPPALNMVHLEAGARAQLERPRDNDARLQVPKVRLSHVVLPAWLRRQVEEIVSASRNRRTVLERWKIGSHLTYGKGLSALFHGAPGTGKTLCAEAIAGELGRPLLSASIASVVSKFVGETESNLEAIFHQAKAKNAVLFLDEADSLLMERGQGGSTARHDDSVVNVLLTLVEQFDGLVLFATNRLAVLDQALARRLSYSLEFPFPSVEARARIWEALLPSTVPTAGPIATDALAKRFALSGGLIKNVVFKAAFRAASQDRPLAMADLEAAATEELQKQSLRQTSPVGFAVA